MKKRAVQQKIINLEAQVEALKRFFGGKLDLSIDEKNWNRVRRDLKKARQQTYKRFYGAT